MTKKQIWPILAIVIGIIINSVSGLLIVAYILEAFVKRAGDPYQSLVFWYLPLLLFGLIGMIIGIVSVGWGSIRLKKIKKNDM